MAGEPSLSPSRRESRQEALVVAGVLVVAMAIIALLVPYALPMIGVELIAALMIVVPPALAGLWLVPVFRLGPMPLRWHLLLGAALGTGSTSILVLLLGLVGILYSYVWLFILLLMGVSGVIRLRNLLGGSDTIAGELSQPGQKGTAISPWFWLAAAPFLAAALLAASNAPGMIWRQEGFGYDVLEYHLEMPREYFDAGRIFYAAHNVYANFPANVEMLYLLAMVVQRATVDAGVTANMIHLLFAGLTVFAAAAAGRDHSRGGAVVAGATTTACLWLVYLSGLAYVENAMLFYGMVAAAMLVRAGGSADSSRSNSPHGSLLAAGVIGGLACGCKYTALPLIILPLAVIPLAVPAPSLTQRLKRGAIFLLATAATFAPWLLKNAAMTGNPVFPLANSVFHASPPGWNEKCSVRWQEGHRPVEAERPPLARMRMLWDRTLGDPLQRLAWPIAVLPIAGLFARRRDRTDGALASVLVLQLLIWIVFTHLYARFAVVFMIPLLLLVGRALGTRAASWRRNVAMALLLVSAAWGMFFAMNLFQSEAPGGVYGGIPASAIYEGEIPGYEYLGFVNEELPADARILLVGDARAFYVRHKVDYCVVFNACPFVEAVRSAQRPDRGPAVLAWLEEKGYSHVMVHWGEIRRLRKSAYGFPEEVNRELFEDMERAGLYKAREFRLPGSEAPYITVFLVP